jgi:creatinine amidohydrolase
MGSQKRSRWWGEFRADQFRAVDPMETIAILPLAATEQHGPHLPVCVDSAINQGHLDALIAALPEEMDIRILPLQQIGKSDEHADVPGTITLRAPLLIEMWTEIGLCVARTGIRKIVLVNSHGGNEEVIGIVARELRVRAGMLAVKTAWLRFGKPERLFSDREAAFGIHGGDVETSLMLHFRPDLVAMDAAEDFPSVAEGDTDRFSYLRPTGPHAYAWIARDLNPAGAVGEADRASAEKGRLLCAHTIAGFIRLLEDVRRAPLPD